MNLCVRVCVSVWVFERHVQGPWCVRWSCTIMSVCMWFLNQSLGPVETTAVFASSQIAHILTPGLHIPIPGCSAQSKLTNISTPDQQLCLNQQYMPTWVQIRWIEDDAAMLAVGFGLFRILPVTSKPTQVRLVHSRWDLIQDQSWEGAKLDLL